PVQRHLHVLGHHCGGVNEALHDPCQQHECILGIDGGDRLAVSAHELSPIAGRPAPGAPRAARHNVENEQLKPEARAKVSPSCESSLRLRFRLQSTSAMMLESSSTPPERSLSIALCRHRGIKMACAL